jgi:hypothetical protein
MINIRSVRLDYQPPVNITFSLRTNQRRTSAASQSAILFSRNKSAPATGRPIDMLPSVWHITLIHISIYDKVCIYIYLCVNRQKFNNMDMLYFVYISICINCHQFEDFFWLLSGTTDGPTHLARWAARHGPYVTGGSGLRWALPLITRPREGARIRLTEEKQPPPETNPHLLHHAAAALSARSLAR